MATRAALIEAGRRKLAEYRSGKGAAPAGASASSATAAGSPAAASKSRSGPSTPILPPETPCPLPATRGGAADATTTHSAMAPGATPRSQFAAVAAGTIEFGTPPGRGRPRPPHGGGEGPMGSAVASLRARFGRGTATSPLDLALTVSPCEDQENVAELRAAKARLAAGDEGAGLRTPLPLLVAAGAWGDGSTGGTSRRATVALAAVPLPNTASKPTLPAMRVAEDVAVGSKGGEGDCDVDPILLSPVSSTNSFSPASLALGASPASLPGSSGGPLTVPALAALGPPPSSAVVSLDEVLKLKQRISQAADARASPGELLHLYQAYATRLHALLIAQASHTDEMKSAELELQARDWSFARSHEESLLAHAGAMAADLEAERARTAALTAERDAAQRGAAAAEAKAAHLAAQVAAVQGERDAAVAATGAVSQHAAAMTALEAEAARLRAQAAMAASQVSSLMVDAESARGGEAAAAAEAARLRAETEFLTSQLRELQAAMTTRREEAAAVRADRDAVRAECDKWRGLAVTHESMARAMQTEAFALQERVAALSTEADELRRQAADVAEARDAALASARSTSATLASIRDDASRAKAEAAVFRDELARMRADGVAPTAAVATRTPSASACDASTMTDAPAHVTPRAEVEALQDQLIIANAMTEAAQGEVNALLQRLVVTQAAATEAKAAADAKGAALAEAAADAADRMSRWAVLEHELAAAKGRLLEVQRSLAEAQAAGAAAATEARTARDARVDAERERESLQLLLHETTLAMEQAQAGHAAQIAALQKQHDSAAAEAAAMHSSEASRLRAARREAETALAAMQAKLEAAQAEATALAAEVDSARSVASAAAVTRTPRARDKDAALEASASEVEALAATVQSLRDAARSSSQQLATMQAALAERQQALAAAIADAAEQRESANTAANRAAALADRLAAAEAASAEAAAGNETQRRLLAAQLAAVSDAARAAAASHSEAAAAAETRIAALTHDAMAARAAAAASAEALAAAEVRAARMTTQAETAARCLSDADSDASRASARAAAAAERSRGLEAELSTSQQALAVTQAHLAEARAALAASERDKVAALQAAATGEQTARELQERLADVAGIASRVSTLTAELAKARETTAKQASALQDAASRQALFAKRQVEATRAAEEARQRVSKAEAAASSLRDELGAAKAAAAAADARAVEAVSAREAAMAEAREARALAAELRASMAELELAATTAATAAMTKQLQDAAQARSDGSDATAPTPTDAGAVPAATTTAAAAGVQPLAPAAATTAGDAEMERLRCYVSLLESALHVRAPSDLQVQRHGHGVPTQSGPAVTAVADSPRCSGSTAAARESPWTPYDDLDAPATPHASSQPYIHTGRSFSTSAALARGQASSSGAGADDSITADAGASTAAPRQRQRRRAASVASLPSCMPTPDAADTSALGASLLVAVADRIPASAAATIAAGRLAQSTGAGDLDATLLATPQPAAPPGTVSAGRAVVATVPPAAPGGSSAVALSDGHPRVLRQVQVSQSGAISLVFGAPTPQLPRSISDDSRRASLAVPASLGPALAAAAAGGDSITAAAPHRGSDSNGGSRIVRTDRVGPRAALMYTPHKPALPASAAGAALPQRNTSAGIARAVPAPVPALAPTGAAGRPADARGLLADKLRQLCGEVAGGGYGGSLPDAMLLQCALLADDMLRRDRGGASAVATAAAPAVAATAPLRATPTTAAAAAGPSASSSCGGNAASHAAWCTLPPASADTGSRARARVLAEPLAAQDGPAPAARVVVSLGAAAATAGGPGRPPAAPHAPARRVGNGGDAASTTLRVPEVR